MRKEMKWMVFLAGQICWSMETDGQRPTPFVVPASNQFTECARRAFFFLPTSYARHFGMIAMWRYTYAILGLSLMAIYPQNQVITWLSVAFPLGLIIFGEKCHGLKQKFALCSTFSIWAACAFNLIKAQYSIKISLPFKMTVLGCIALIMLITWCCYYSGIEIRVPLCIIASNTPLILVTQLGLRAAKAYIMLPLLLLPVVCFFMFIIVVGTEGEDRSGRLIYKAFNVLSASVMIFIFVAMLIKGFDTSGLMKVLFYVGFGLTCVPMLDIFWSNIGFSVPALDNITRLRSPDNKDKKNNYKQWLEVLKTELPTESDSMKKEKLREIIKHLEGILTIWEKVERMTEAEVDTARKEGQTEKRMNELIKKFLNAMQEGQRLDLKIFKCDTERREAWFY